MKKLPLLFLLLPLFASAQQKPKMQAISRFCAPIIDTLSLPSYTLEPPWNPPPPITVRIYVDDDDPVQTLIDALKKAGVIVERIEWNYEKKYSDYLITKKY